MFKKNLDLISRKLRLNFYFRPQTYQASYRVEVLNNSDFRKEFFLVLPIISNHHYQTLKSVPVFSKSFTGRGEDLKYHNSYAFWELKLEPQETFKVEEDFKIKVWPQINKKETRFKLQDYELDPKDQIYLQNNSFLNLDNSNLGDLVDEIVGPEERTKEILEKINNYLVFKLNYGQPIKGLYSAKEALEKKAVDCGGFSTLLVSLAILKGIPARVLSGFWAGHKENTMHAWPEVLLPSGKWMSLDPAVENLYQQKKTLKFGFLNGIGSDRIVFSRGCDLPIILGNQKVKVPILQNPFIYPNNGLRVKANFLTKKI